MSDSILAYYDRGAERPRLVERVVGRLERDRTRDIAVRHLPPAPAHIADIGGGPGIYAEWLTRLGYEVHLLDLSPLHVEQAAELGLAEAVVGDATELPWSEDTFDAALLLGPLYHLQEREERVKAWSEAARVVRPGGVVIGAAISRFASALDGLSRKFLDDPRFEVIVEHDLRTGCHHNPTAEPGWFTTAYFHRPEELAEEVAAAGLEHVGTFAVEGPVWLLGDLATHTDPQRWQRLLGVLRRLEQEPSLLGASGHLLAIGRI